MPFAGFAGQQQKRKLNYHLKHVILVYCQQYGAAADTNTAQTWVVSHILSYFVNESSRHKCSNGTGPTAT